MSAETLDDYLAPLGAPDWGSDDYLDIAKGEREAGVGGYTLTDDDAADWALRKLAKARADIEQAERMADERKKLIDRWLQDSTASDCQTVEFFTGLLSEYHSRVLADDPDRKTLDLPSGRVKSRTYKPAVVIDDLDELVEWLVEVDRADEITWTPKVGVRKVRKFVTAHDGDPVDMDLGERVPGLSVRPGKTSFTVDPS